MTLVFALQKLSMVSSSTRMADKMPVVSGLGEQFAWANLMFDSNATDGGIIHEVLITIPV